MEHYGDESDMNDMEIERDISISLGCEGYPHDISIFFWTVYPSYNPRIFTTHVGYEDRIEYPWLIQSKDIQHVL